MTTTEQNHSRTITRISLANFHERTNEIKEQLFHAATTEGFFVLCDQASPSPADIGEMFSLSEQFFQLEKAQKLKTPHIKLLNTGYECMAQVRPSMNGVPDPKESLQLQWHRKDENWPHAEDVGETWREKTQRFVEMCQELSMLVLLLFAEKLGYPADFFTKAHDITAKETAQSTLRLLHYFGSNDTSSIEGGHSNANGKPPKWRAGPHTDFDCLTLLFTKEGDTGFEYCPGRETHTSFGHGDNWTTVPLTKAGDIVVNIGDMLMSWSDDRLKSNFHRVRMPEVPQNGKLEDRYSIGWFNQANKDVVIQGPLKKYPALTGKQFIENAMKRNFDRLQKEQKNADEEAS